MIRPKVEIVISALLKGVPITIREHTYKLFKKGDSVATPSMEGVSEGYWLGVELEDPKGKYLGVDFSFIQLLDMIDSLSEAEVVGISGNSVLYTLRIEKLRVRIRGE